MEQNHVKGLMFFVICGIIAFIAFVSCQACSTSSSVPYSAPASFAVSNEGVAQVVRDAIAGDSYATKMNGSPVVNCTGETTGTIATGLKGPGRPAKPPG